MFKVNFIKENKKIKCRDYVKNSSCDGNLHSIAPIYYQEDPLNCKYKCKCDKCNAEIILNFDPDQF